MFEVARTGVAPMICKDEHPDPWSDLVNVRSFRRPIQAATAMAAAALITLAGCGPVEDAPAPETETVEQGDSAAGDDPDAAANEDGTEAGKRFRALQSVAHWCSSMSSSPSA